MSNITIKELPREGEFPKPSVVCNWDVVIHGKEYVVGEFKEYAHSISYSLGKEIINRLYCWPRGEEPNHENIVEYNMPASGPVNWGILYEPHNIISYKYDDMEMIPVGMITITRNGKKFYEFRGSMHTGIDQDRKSVV